MVLAELTEPALPFMGMLLAEMMDVVWAMGYSLGRGYFRGRPRPRLTANPLILVTFNHGS
jgi:hypothetical protein